MSFRNLIAAVALLSAAATASAAYTSSIPESASVTMVFIALATVSLAAHRKTPRTPASRDA